MNIKKHITLPLVMAAALLCGACAKEYKANTTQLTRDAFDAWVKVHYPNAVIDSTPWGVLVIEDKAGAGAVIPDTSYVCMEYCREIMETGKIETYTSADVARQLGKYNESNYYGPRLQYIAKGISWLGISEVIEGGPKLGRMKEGGTRKVIMPAWLATPPKDSYKDVKDYIANVSGSNYIYTITTGKIIKDPQQWQIDSIKNYLAAAKFKADTTVSKGIFYGMRKAGSSDRKFPNDTTIYINYTGRLLNGKVFDTTLKDTAKVHGIYSASRTYQPVSITTAADSTAYKMGGSSDVISGFSLTIHQMHPHEHGTGLFVSDYGYKDTGSGESIPPYSPLIFEIEVVDKP